MEFDKNVTWQFQSG